MKNQFQQKNLSSPQKWSKFSFSFLIIVFAIILLRIITVSYQEIYKIEIEGSRKLTEINNLIIKSQYVTTEKVIQTESGEEKAITELVHKNSIPIIPPIPPKPEKIEAKAIYLTARGVTSSVIYTRALRLLEETELNAVIIDIKDYSGKLSYSSEIPLVKEIGADKNPIIKDMKKIIDELHEKNIYVIARQTLFQDPVLSKQRPEWAVQNKYTGNRWVDRKGLGWMDPAAKEVWDYNIAIAKEAVSLGFDEINLDYIRFPTDGNLKAMKFNFHPDDKPKHETIRDFLKYFSEAMEDEPTYTSVDFFGLVTVKVKAKDDLGIGQLLVDAIPYVDYIYPMVYPSHYANNFIGLKNPALYPYEVVKYSLEKAKEGFDPELLNGLEPRAKIRPWLQDFDMGAVYDASMVRAQIKAAEETNSDGWLLWDPRNFYTEGALKKIKNKE